MSALPAPNHERRRILRERVKRIADQNKSLMDQIISALEITEDGDKKDDAKGEKDDPKSE